MVITCPSCKRRFKLPVDRVRTRHAKLKCSKCQSVFVQDLSELADRDDSQATDAERSAIASAPSRPDIRIPVMPPASPPSFPPPPPFLPVGPEPPPPPAPRPAPVPVPRPAPAPVQHYESFAEIPDVDREHEEALERARVAAEIKADEDALASAVAEAAAKVAALPDGSDVPVDVEPPPVPETPEPAPAEAAPPEATEPEPPVEAASAPATVPTGAPSSPSGARPRPARNDGALDLFGSTPRAPAPPRGSAPAAGAAPAEYVLDLTEEAPDGSGLRRLGIAVVVILLLAGAFVLFVAARNHWKLDFAHFGAQVKRSFGVGGEVLEDRACLVVEARTPMILDVHDGRIVIVRGTLQDICPRSIAGARVQCRLEGPGGPWYDEALPLKTTGASSISESSLRDLSATGVAAEIQRQENPAGVAVPDATHEFWCLFPSAAGSDSRMTSFKATTEVQVP
jgi:predicted Zn finger-like uncharacterized protein